MKAIDIQKILQQEREKSPIKGLSPAEINRKLGAVMAGENKRKVPVADYTSIMFEYWDRDTLRPLYFTQTIGDRYGVKAGVIDKIISNFYNTLTETEYQILTKKYTDKFDRSDVMKQLHASGKRDNKKIGKKISLAKNTVSREIAMELYEKTFQGRNTRSHAYFKQLAKEYGISFNKAKTVANGHHPALKHKDVKKDVRNWEIKFLGIYKFTSPEGVEYVFDNLYDVGAFLWKTEHGLSKNKTANWGKGRMWFERTEPNTLYVKRRRFWKGWEYINIIQ